MSNSFAGSHGVHRIKVRETLSVRLKKFYQPKQVVHVRCIIFTLIPKCHCSIIPITHHSIIPICYYSIILLHVHHIALVVILDVCHGRLANGTPASSHSSSTPLLQASENILLKLFAAASFQV